MGHWIGSGCAFTVLLWRGWQCGGLIDELDSGEDIDGGDEEKTTTSFGDSERARNFIAPIFEASPKHTLRN